MAGWRRPALALGAPLVAAVAVAIAVSGRGCEDDSGAPEATVRQFLDAARQMDREALFALLGPRTREQLAAEARRATDLSSRRYAPADMIGFNTGLDDLAAGDPTTRRLSIGDAGAEVELTDRRGHMHVLHLVLVDGEWRIELSPDD